MKGQKITLTPKDYIMFRGGLKIENISEENAITFRLPSKYTIDLMKFELKNIGNKSKSGNKSKV